MDGNFVWPKVSKVAEYRKKVRQTMLDVIENTPLELPVTQESKWVMTLLISAPSCEHFGHFASGKNIWRLKFWQKSPIGDQQIKRET